MPHGRRVSPALVPARDRLRALLERFPDTPTRYAIGTLVKEIKSAPRLYGAGAVVHLAATTGADLATLYRHASVVGCWTLAQVERLLTRRGAYLLSWSHLVAIATLQAPSERAGWIARCRAEGLSLRELATRLGAAGAPPGGESEALHRLERALRAVERLSEQAADLQRTLSRRALPAAVRDHAIALHERLRILAERQLGILRSAPVRARKSRSSGRIPGSAARGRPAQRRSQR
jgi:hypothetical protein